MTGMVMAQEMVMTTGWSYTHLPLRQILQYWATKRYEAVIIAIYELIDPYTHTYIYIYSSLKNNKGILSYLGYHKAIK